MFREYNVGDEVTIKSLEEILQYADKPSDYRKDFIMPKTKINFLFTDMGKMCGQKATIAEVLDRKISRYALKGSMWVWTPEMFVDGEIKTSYKELLL